ncbi:aminoglycoside phosphotransferase family protein [Ectobacillus sp. JY-23]|uniref:phosphotransferase n=1 Tax=Ectobacillus sp. JY-23 TaxID=2933872 RepID=UPI001FF52E98|nr:phosphotransferase [Ectobacillus sp. JY-23]UOY94141.1 aminoglycoside phosphotransferase family protein [Ectobacillus sp. JY-23]
MIQNKQGKGDAFTARLFSFLRTYMPVYRIVQLKTFVYMVYTEEHIYIVKGYKEIYKVHQQSLLLSELQQVGFSQTTCIRPFASNVLYMPFSDVYWLVMDYISHTELFTLAQKENRFAGLQVLTKYHQYAKLLPQHIRSMVPKLDWLVKWEKRLRTFFHSRDEISRYVGSEIVSDILGWAYTALRALYMEDIRRLPSCVLHGDVVAHNFIKAEQVYLIDFDCVSYGPCMYDYIKYFHAIMPDLSWDYEAICEEYTEYPFMNIKVFLLGLIFPGDLLREWQYFILLPEETKTLFEEKIITFTIEHYEKRTSCLRQLLQRANQVKY